jgi:arginine utilization protein RocB
MLDPHLLEDEIDEALKRARLAYLAFKTVSEQSPNYQQALNGYLQAMVHHITVLSVAQVLMRCRNSSKDSRRYSGRAYRVSKIGELPTSDVGTFAALQKARAV